MPSYQPADVERRWQQFWETNKTFRTPDPDDASVAGKPKYYILDMFPYPSGAGLHVGHPEGYTATDILARFKRMTGCHVLHPMGWDAYGLPAEEYARKTGKHPRITTQENINTFRRQIKSLGFSYDWDREVDTTDANYFKWTQWIFLTIYDSWYDAVQQKGRPISELPIPPAVQAQGDAAVRKYQDDHRLAYQAEVPVNWCPAMGTVLANEEVQDGKSEVGGFPVERRPLRQWLMRITAYAERLLSDLEPLDWSHSIKEMQRNWIGKSEGAEVTFTLASSPGPAPSALSPGSADPGLQITVFTTRPDTLFGATYMVLSPEHPLLAHITTPDHAAAVKEYQQAASRKSDFERTETAKKKTGVFTGAYAVNPVYNEKIPIWIADYVLATYGTGAIMAVPGHDLRDFEFAKQYGLDIQSVVKTVTSAPWSNSNTATLWAERANAMEDIIVSHNLLNTPFTHLDYITEQNRALLNTHVEQNPLAYLVITTNGHTVVAHSDEQFDETKLNSDPSNANAVPGVPKLWLKAQTSDGVAVNSDFLNGMPTAEAKQKIIAWLEEKKIGARRVNYKLRDWLFSRQRYWGEPFPVLHGPDGERVTVPVGELPLIPPDLEDFKPTGTPEGPLSKATDWVHVEIGGKPFTRETNTMPQWAGSCWYFLRYIDPKNATAFADPEKLKYWLPVDLYVGGAEHAVLHLLYARFWHKVLYDRGALPCPEPFQRLVNQGMILGEYEYHISVESHAVNGTNLTAMGISALHRKSEDEKKPDAYVLKVQSLEGDALVNLPDELVEKVKGKMTLKGTGIELATKAEKMSKSRGNVVNPDDIVTEYGADSLRLYEMFMGPLEAVKPWDTKSIKGVYGFLTRAWRLVVDDGEEFKLHAAVTDATPDRDTLRVLHSTIQKVTKDTEGLSFNTAISAMMEFVNHVTKLDVRPRSVLEPFVLLLAPYAPHVAEELWAALGHGPTLAYAPWPTFDPELTKVAEIDVPVQINGKLRTVLKVPAEIDDAALEAAALADEKVKESLVGKTVKKTIVKSKKLVNLVVG